MVVVTKFDGTRQEFQREKVVKTCLRLHATRGVAERIADKIEGEVYEGIPTRKILEMVYGYLRKYKPAIEHLVDLREAIGRLRSKPDFEQFVRILLGEEGYRVTSNQFIRGRCIEYEVDAVAMKGGDTVLVEVKHNVNPHSYEGVDVCLKVWATMEDVLEGYRLNINQMGVNRALIACNTRFSDHAKQFSACRNISLLGWRMPEVRGMERIIEDHGLYPITMIRDLEAEVEARLADNGIILIRQLAEFDASELSVRLGIGEDRLKSVVEKAEAIKAGLSRWEA